jgi:HSP20 family molecular chaperone IbpA
MTVTDERRAFMATMRVVGAGHKLPAHANVREEPDEYVIELDVADFTESEITLEALGPQLTVRGDQVGTSADDGRVFRMHERLEETFRLPDDADLSETRVFFKHGVVEIHAPRMHLEPRQLPFERSPFPIDPDAEAC